MASLNVFGAAAWALNTVKRLTNASKQTLIDSIFLWYGPENVDPAIIAMSDRDVIVFRYFL